jgi:hypothetical protein
MFLKALIELRSRSVAPASRQTDPPEDATVIQPGLLEDLEKSL